MACGAYGVSLHFLNIFCIQGVFYCSVLLVLQPRVAAPHPPTLPPAEGQRRGLYKNEIYVDGKSHVALQR